MIRRVGSMLVVIALSLVVVGCGGAENGAVPDTSGTDVGAPSENDVVDAAELLTPADVEDVSGLTGLKVVPYEPSIGAGGDLNIATADGQLVTMLSVDGPAAWDAWLTDGYTVSEPVTPPVGDEAFIGPNPDVSPVVYLFGFRKGDVAVLLDTYFDTNGETILSVEQLRELAEIVHSRL